MRTTRWILSMLTKRLLWHEWPLWTEISTIANRTDQFESFQQTYSNCPFIYTNIDNTVFENAVLGDHWRTSFIEGVSENNSIIQLSLTNIYTSPRLSLRPTWDCSGIERWRFCKKKTPENKTAFVKNRNRFTHSAHFAFVGYSIKTYYSAIKKYLLNTYKRHLISVCSLRCRVRSC